MAYKIIRVPLSSSQKVPTTLTPSSPPTETDYIEVISPVDAMERYLNLYESDGWSLVGGISEVNDRVSNSGKTRKLIAVLKK